MSQAAAKPLWEVSLLRGLTTKTADQGPSFLPAVLIWALEATVHGIHQKAKQTTEQGFGQEISVKFSHLYCEPSDDGVS